MQRPVVSETIIPVNEDLNAHYTVFTENTSFRRMADWSMLFDREPVVTLDNPRIEETLEPNVGWLPKQHIMLVIGGSAVFQFKTPDGPTKDYLWTIGDSNSCNGVGYLPERGFTRIFKADHQTCCMLPSEQADPTVRYDFFPRKPGEQTSGLCHIALGTRAGQSIIEPTTILPDELAIEIVRLGV